MRETSVKLLASHIFPCHAEMSNVEKSGNWCSFWGKKCATTKVRDDYELRTFQEMEKDAQ